MQHLMFVGKMASGKTTMAKFCEGTYGYTPISLADPIKKVVYGMNQGYRVVNLVEEHIFPYTDLTGAEKDKVIAFAEQARSIADAAPKYRKQLQFFGTDGCRDKIAQDIWIRVLYGRIDEYPNKLYAVDDCRFTNEYQELLDLFRPVILFMSPEEQLKRMRELYGDFDPTILTHASESEFELIKALAMQEPNHIEINSNLPLDFNKEFLSSKLKE